MIAFFKALDVTDLRSQATDIRYDKLGCTLESHSLQAKYPWHTNATHKEAEIHLEQRSEVGSGSCQ